jgi:hypothetical protein
MKEGFEGNLEMVKEDAITKWYCADIGHITDVEQVYSKEGKIKTKYCRIYHSMLGDRVVRTSYLEMKNMLKTVNTNFFKDN